MIEYQNVNTTNYTNTPQELQNQNYLRSTEGAMQEKPKDKELLGSNTDDVAYKQNIKTGKEGNIIKVGGVTTALRYRVQAKAGEFGFRSMGTERFRNPYKSRLWSFQLTSSSGPNKAPHGIAQSSLDTTRERYTTAETRAGKSGVYNRSEQWNEKTQTFERRWKGWKDLKINKTWKHYGLNLAPMFKNRNTDIGTARRATRDTRTAF